MSQECSTPGIVKDVQILHLMQGVNGASLLRSRKL